MAYLEFNEKLMVGNQLMDQEHELLIEYINLLHKAVNHDASAGVVGTVLQGVVDYTSTHFFLEEEMMQVFDYPDYPAHKKAHDGFKDQANKLLASHNSGAGSMNEEVMSFLQDWLTSHILKIDTKLAAFLKGKTLQ